MARRRSMAPQQGPGYGGFLGGGWAGSVLRTLVSIFVIAIVFGVFLDATVITNNTLINTPGASTNIGTTGQSAVSVYQTLIGYLVTLANFVGIIILLVIIMIVILVIYALFAPVGGMGGGGGFAGV
jgi:hypothetical protein